MIVLEPPMAASFAGEKSVADFLRIHCQVVRRFKNRWTGRFERDGRAYYIKAHGPAGWKFVLDELLHLRLPQIGARAEWQALLALKQLGIPAATIAVFGEHGLPSPWQQSFLVTQEIPRTISLETLFLGPRAPRPGSQFRRRLVRAVAQIARALHQNGINHRDFYLCHFLLDISAGMELIEDSEPRLCLIDLHRAQRRKRVPRRWIVKDLAGLLFSASELGLTTREKLLFARIYTGRSTRESVRDDSSVWQTISERAQRLQRKLQKRSANLAVAARWNPI